MELRSPTVTATNEPASWLGKTLVLSGNLDAARGIIERHVAPGPLQANGLALVYQAMGRQAESALQLAELIDLAANARDAELVAEVYAYRGDHAEAMDWLARRGTRFSCKEYGDIIVIVHSPFLREMDGFPEWDRWRADAERVMKQCALAMFPPGY